MFYEVEKETSLFDGEHEGAEEHVGWEIELWASLKSTVCHFFRWFSCQNFHTMAPRGHILPPVYPAYCLTEKLVSYPN